MDENEQLEGFLFMISHYTRNQFIHFLKKKELPYEMRSLILQNSIKVSNIIKTLIEKHNFNESEMNEIFEHTNEEILEMLDGSTLDIQQKIEIEFSNSVQQYLVNFQEEGTYSFSSENEKKITGKLDSGRITWELAKNESNYIFGFYSQDQSLEGKTFILKAGLKEKLTFGRISKYLMGCEVEFDLKAQKELIILKNWQISWCEEGKSDESETRSKFNTNGSPQSMD
ncbi:hypothetical protein [Candidatus Uabimicrobium amorphum]|uniref:Uncharacterized protein n=1 Tax=Uabimicrobium amorphum TaxID=2596890 RepID=A0A5S9IU09_UABAM|nr:hypothetical protein [Candidatus Uabimicrobium amorphum]BBM87140.1 hypothetical protein UABAM_05543 [Candidatus Uabimicrobium amorphum]